MNRKLEGEILKILEERKPLTADEIAGRIGATRVKVVNTIMYLRQEGHSIKAQYTGKDNRRSRYEYEYFGMEVGDEQ